MRSRPAASTCGSPGGMPIRRACASSRSPRRPGAAPATPVPPCAGSCGATGSRARPGRGGAYAENREGGPRGLPSLRLEVDEDQRWRRACWPGAGRWRPRAVAPVQGCGCCGAQLARERWASAPHGGRLLTDCSTLGAAVSNHLDKSGVPGRHRVRQWGRYWPLQWRMQRIGHRRQSHNIAQFGQARTRDVRRFAGSFRLLCQV